MVVEHTGLELPENSRETGHRSGCPICPTIESEGIKKARFVRRAVRPEFSGVPIPAAVVTAALANIASSVIRCKSLPGVVLEFEG